LVDRSEPPTPRRSRRTLAKEYQTAHPNVTLNVSTGAPTTDDLLTKLSAGFTSGNYPDISYAYGSWATELAGSGHTPEPVEIRRRPGHGVETKSPPPRGPPPRSTERSSAFRHWSTTSR
jgi:hypothetical protein